MSVPSGSAIRNLVVTLLVALAMMIAGAPRVVRAQDTTNVAAGERNVGPVRSGDVLRIVVYLEHDMSGDFPIDSRGVVQIPGLGDIPVAGLNPVEVKSRLKEALNRRGIANPELSVQPLIRVAILGEVGSPGPKQIDPGTSIVQLLALSGGPTPNANLAAASVLREGRSVPVDLSNALAGSGSGRIILYSNDVVVIPARHRFFSQENLGWILGLTSTAIAVINLVVTLRR